MIAHRVQQRGARLDVDGLLRAVHVEDDRTFAGHAFRLCLLFFSFGLSP